ncbi:hypothetical protein JZ751_016822 [Albula glossodonta]|uniref:Uncharacterized protein n=1 Tax=Albula glossodonta TaxID=121402 RepID=A0A8T2NT33_9TELE|nr:hypothetical protein JZ751_016822 [Albula glossodonta]
MRGVATWTADESESKRTAEPECGAEEAVTTIPTEIAGARTDLISRINLNRRCSQAPCAPPSAEPGARLPSLILSRIDRCVPGTTSGSSSIETPVNSDLARKRLERHLHISYCLLRLSLQTSEVSIQTRLNSK